jgi:hypothetical protein
MSTFGDESSLMSHDDDVGDSNTDSAEANGEGNSSSNDSTLAANYKEVRDMTKKENENVETMRDLVTGVLVITATIISISAFIFLSSNETDAFNLAVREIMPCARDNTGTIDNLTHCFVFPFCSSRNTWSPLKIQQRILA